jgi:hypothetical protein
VSQGPDVSFPLPAPVVAPAVSSLFPASAPDCAAPLFPPLGELWTSSVFQESDRLSYDPKLVFFSKKADEDKSLTVGASNASGIGPQCVLMKDDDSALLGRVAGRYSQVVPGFNDEERVSQVFLGCQLEHRLSGRNKLLSAVEYACDPTDPSSHCLRTQAAWEVLLDPQENLSLRTAVQESSNYTPNREQTKNVDYNLNMSWKF